mgnify:CR=1 FL=1
MCIGDQRYDDIEHVADAFENLINDLEFEPLEPSSLAYHAIGAHLDSVNWIALAEHHVKNTDCIENHLVLA